ncbi:histone deacetylase RPD3 [Mucidula mucida]|nr:histone deacetylase RPD3 [Mucidula mucida]
MNNLKKRVSYYYDSDVGAYTYGLGHPMKPHRIRVAHDLIVAYDMLPMMHVLRPPRASPEAMTAFHTDEYIHFLNRVTPETSSELTYGGTRFLVGEDNPPFEGVFEFCSISAGGSIAAARRLTSGAADIAINWAGGLHHAKKREASGFCYINDIVLGILELLRSYPRVLYIDIDCHHGDGVEEAFYTTDRVMTCSFHKYGEYFPGTGTQSDKGRGKGKGYAVNVPLKDGISDDSFASIFEPIISQIIESFQPGAIVLQCGADSLSGDKLGCFNISMAGHAHCVQFVRKQNIPFILLGGGGYTVKNVARTWAFETACALGIENEIDRSLPWNEYFEWFGPRYRLEVVQNNMEDLNVKDGSLETVKINALEQIRALKTAPSVAMQDTPRESLLDELGFGKETTERDALDESLAQHSRFVYKLQDSDVSESSSEDDESDNSESATRRRSRHSRVKRHTNGRMSLLTGRYFDVQGHHNHKESKPKNARRFFQSRLGWSDMHEKVVVKGEEADFFARGRLAELMERGGSNVNATEDRWGSEERLSAAEDEWIEMDED